MDTLIHNDGRYQNEDGKSYKQTQVSCIFIPDLPTLVLVVIYKINVNQTNRLNRLEIKKGLCDILDSE